MTSRHFALHRQDDTAKALIAEAKAYGAKYLPLNGVVDGVLFFRSRVYVVDWKGTRTKLTSRQSKLLAEGFPMTIIPLTNPRRLWRKNGRKYTVNRVQTCRL